MRISVVTSLYNSERLLVEFYQRISAAVQSVNEEYEIILINDGSSDASLSVAKDILKNDPRVRLIDFTKNFGFPEALYCGLKYATGEYIFLIDSDLEEPPEVFSQFWNYLNKSPELDAVHGVQSSRKGKWFERWSGGLFYFIVDVFFPSRYERNVLAVRIFRSEYKDKVLSYHPLISDIWIAFTAVSKKQASLVVKKGHKGWTTFNFSKKSITAIKILTDLSIVATLEFLSKRQNSFCLRLKHLLLTRIEQRRQSKLYKVKSIYHLEQHHEP